VEITFIINPIGPVVLRVIICTKETTTDTANADSGPKINPTNAMTISLGSYRSIKGPADNTGIRPTAHITYDIALRQASVLSFFVLEKVAVVDVRMLIPPVFLRCSLLRKERKKSPKPQLRGRDAKLHALFLSSGL